MILNSIQVRIKEILIPRILRCSEASNNRILTLANRIDKANNNCIIARQGKIRILDNRSIPKANRNTLTRMILIMRLFILKKNITKIKKLPILKRLITLSSIMKRVLKINKKSKIIKILNSSNKRNSLTPDTTLP